MTLSKDAPRLKLTCALTLFIMALLLSANATAHSKLVKTEPPANAVLDAPPQQVKLIFNRGLESTFSKIRISNSNGQRVDNNDTRVSGGKNNVLEVGFKGQTAGEYTVKYNAVAADGHKVKGEYRFNIK